MEINSLPKIIDYVNELPSRYAASFKESVLGSTPLAYKLLRFKSCLEVVTEDEPIVVAGLFTDYLLLAVTLLKVDTFPRFTLEDYLSSSKQHTEEFKLMGKLHWSSCLEYKADSLYDVVHQSLLFQIGCDVECPLPDLLVDLQEFYSWVFNAVVDVIAKGGGPFLEVALANVTSNSTL